MRIILRENYQLKASPNLRSQGTTYPGKVLMWRVFKRTIFIHCITSCEDCKLKHGYALFSFLTFEQI